MSRRLAVRARERTVLSSGATRRRRAIVPAGKWDHNLPGRTRRNVRDARRLLPRASKSIATDERASGAEGEEGRGS